MNVILPSRGVSCDLFAGHKHLFTTLFLFLFTCSINLLQAQNTCTWEEPQGTVTNQNFENDGTDITPDNPASASTSFSYTIPGNTFSVGDGGLAGVVLDADLDIEICFWGDMNGADENFDVTIEGSSAVTVNVEMATSAADPYCQTFTLTIAEASTALADGQITVTYDNLGTDWYPQILSPGINLNTGSNNFNAQVAAISANYSYAIEDDPIPVFCQAQPNVDLGTYVSGQTATSAFDNFSGNGVLVDGRTLDLSASEIEISTLDRDAINAINYNFICDDNSDLVDQFLFQVYEVPVATLMDGVVSCGVTGNYNLNELFVAGTTSGGTFTTSTPDAEILGGNYLSFSGFGCVDITYTLENPGNCSGVGEVLTADAMVFFPETPTPSFSITSSTTCWDGDSDLIVEVSPSEFTYTGTLSRLWTATGTNLSVSVTDETTDSPVITVSNPTSLLGSLQICYEESINTPAGTCTEGTDCAVQSCTTITIASSGCNEDCLEFNPAADVCPILTNSFISLTIFNVTFDLGSELIPFFEASVVTGDYVEENNFDAGGTEDPIITCDDEGIAVSWDFGLNNDFFPEGDALDTPIADNISGVGDVCDLVDDVAIPYPTGFCGNCGPGQGFCINILGVRPCITTSTWKPLEFLDFSFDIPITGESTTVCSATVRDLIVDPVQEIVEETAVSVVWADTDGDGAFDQVLSGAGILGDGSGDGSGFVYNNVDGEGIITVRNVTASVIAPYSPCVTPDGVDLLEILPIDFIPVAGPIIRQALTSAGINVNIAPSAMYDLPIRVENDEAPRFPNPRREYTFATGDACGEAVNWDIPLAVDGCTGEFIENIVQLSGPTSGSILEPSPGEVNYVDAYGNQVYVDADGNEYPICQNSDGDFVIMDYPQDCEDERNATVVDINDYTPLMVAGYRVEYQATACNGIQTIHALYINVVPGDPILVTPRDLTLRNDVDACSRIVTGIAPLAGLECNTTITWTADNGAVPSSGTDDASGTDFQLGTTTVTYTMTADLNGDGVIDANDPAIPCGESQETQMCTFTITIEDHQKPTAYCSDFTVQLDKTGSATVFATDLDGGSVDNCPGELTIEVSKADVVENFGDAVTFDCFEEGQNTVIVRVLDAAEHDGDPLTDERNERRCLSLVTVVDYFEGFEVGLDVPELCLEANNEEQLNFANYLTIAMPNGTTTTHMDEVLDMDDVVGVFGISTFVRSPGGPPSSGTTVGTSPDNPGDAGYINPLTGEYTPGTGTGFVTITYVLGIAGQVEPGIFNLEGCYILVQDVFELRQPLDMESPECECIVQNDRVVDLGEITGGLEPYTIQYGGVQLDVDSDGVADDADGEFTYDEEAGFDVIDFTEDLGNLLVDYTQPTWSFTIVDARGCELFRSGSCDNDDENGTPEILCEDLGPVALTTDEFVCEAQYTWEHTLPTDNCDVILYTYTITNPDGSIAGPFDITALLNPDITNPLPDQFFATYDFEHFSPTENISTVTYYAEDAVGNFSQCSFEVTVTDDDPPYFINCPEPAVIVDAPPTWCSAYANYSLPLAEDNCDIPVVTQIDDTGLTSGDIYPVGITINTFEAVDATGNTTTCDVKIIVNDYHTPPSFECPGDVVDDNDFGDCGAIVDGIAPFNIEDNCPDNLTVAYRIEDEMGNEVASGLDDASGNFFAQGTSTVRYSLQDMPLLLITEITHDLSDPVDGTLPVPPFTAGNPPTGDYLEITNFNAANLDVSCLMIERLSAAGSELFAVPTGVILAPGGVLTIHFGDGTDSPADHFYNVPGAADLQATDPAAYIVSLSRSILDIAVLNGYDISGLAPPQYNLAGRTVADYWSGTISPVFGSGIVRTTVWDTNTASDFEPGEACLPTTIGMLNPSLPQPTPNGAQTAIQAQHTTRIECSFTVTIVDAEEAVCGLYGDYQEYPGASETIAYGECVESIVTVDEFYTIADLNLFLAGNAGDFSDLTFTLISPEGTAIELLVAACPGSTAFDFILDGDPELAAPFLDNCATLGDGLALIPTGDIEAFNGEQAQGDWILQVGHNGTVTTELAILDAWSLLISAREAYDEMDVTLENDLNLCGAEYTYLHPILFDNCPGGTVQLTITFEDGTLELDQTLPIFPENTEFTYFFQVGETTVLYTLTDAAGNVSTCGFVVTVLDTQFPEITCPDDQVIQLGPGECETNEYPTTPVFEFDNCPDYVLSSFPPGTPVPIGDTTITLIITDASGNETTCTYNLTVLEFETAQDLACIGEQNVSLGADCEATITAEMILTGDLYRCYDNYIVTLYPGPPDSGFDPIPTSPTVTVDYVGQTIVAEICDPDTGECCWGFVNIEYKLIPEFICPSDTVVNCTDLTGPDLLGFPEVTSCVPGGAIISHVDALTDNGACGEPRFVIDRTWTVSDAVGNSAQCVQTIEVATFDLDQIIFPENYDGITNPVLDCSEVLVDPSLTSPDSLGYPTINGTNLYAAIYCSAAINYNDEIFYICDNSYLLFRTWRVVNQCLPNPLSDVREFTQLIRVEDSDGPDLNCPENETISVSPFNCRATYQIPLLDIIDACSEVTYIVQVDNDTLDFQFNNQYLVTGLERGDHTITYLAQDACGIRSQCSYIVTVEDQIAPFAICDDELNVSIGGGDVANGVFGQARIHATDVDEGSSDNCSTVDLEVRRNYWANGTCTDNFEDWSPWGDFIDFYCCDINNEITIELRVTDASGNQNTCWMVITPEDKLNPYCYAPEDVSLTCNDLPLAFPGDIQTAYDEDFAATSTMMSSIFGGATGTDNCAVDTIVERTPNIQVNDCGWGTITRRFEAWQLRPAGDANANGAIDINEVFRSTNSCNQVITITEVHNFVIDFPEDADADCGDPNVPTIITTAEGCDVLTVNIGEPVVYSATGDECYKLSITYDVINWCLWDGEYTGYVLARMTEDDGEALPVDRAVEGNERPVITYTSAAGLCIDRNHTDRDGDSDLDNCASPQLPNYGRYIYTQFVKVYDSTVPVITVPEYGGPTDLCPTLEPGQFGDVTGNCEAQVSIPFTISDECELFDGAGNLVISLVSAELDAFAVDINGDGDITSNEFLVEAGAAGNVMANITDNGDGTYSFDGSFPIITSAMGDNIYHAVRVLFEDGCGNQVSETLVFDVIDCKGPAPICINGLTATLMPQAEGGCAMTIWASDFEGSPIYDCTGQGPLTNADGLPRVTKYAIYRAAEVEADPNFVPHPTNTGLVLTEDDDQTTVVYVYAFDEEDNYDYCETYVLVQPHNSCNGPDGATIAGVITTTANETIEGVEVSINGAAQMSMTTGTDGAFNFELLQLGGDYTVTPYHNDNPLNGVTTFDIVLISKHILNIDPLDSPYQRLAADVNNSETITTLDLIQVRKLILNITTEFTNNTSWRFIPASYVFPNELNPWQETFPELININNLSAAQLNADFIGVKTGDVNGNAQANALAGDDRTLNGIFYLEAEDIDLKAGNTYTVAFTGEDLANVQGFQGTLQFIGMELINMEYGAATSENFGLRYVNEGAITMSYNDNGGDSDAMHLVATTTTTDHLFSLVLRASEDAKLSELLQVNSRYTIAEAYREGTLTDFGLSFSGTAHRQGEFVLYQNVPNPFTEGTMIGFDLPAAATATITIRDAKGALIRVIEGDYGAGYHTVNVTKQMINSTTGVLSYTIEARLANGEAEQAGDYRATKQMIVVD
ncbi:HYR domain-containing protein [Lewinella sp. LCG006]|uniref:HYR domain-containing protein n=1 Tax=Lewinella sp. LCG006 TaxID=3231911 RepID=UPI00346050B4